MYLFNSSALLAFSSFLEPFLPFARFDLVLSAEPEKEADDKVEAAKFIPFPSKCSCPTNSLIILKPHFWYDLIALILSICGSNNIE